MQLRSLISAAAGTAAAISLATQVFAQAAGGKEKESYETRIESRCTECEWTAARTQGVDAVRLTVKGICQEPTPGFKLTLTHVDLPGSDPSTLTLVLTAVDRAAARHSDPGGISASLRFTERPCSNEGGHLRSCCHGPIKRTVGRPPQGDRRILAMSDG